MTVTFNADFVGIPSDEEGAARLMAHLTRPNNFSADMKKLRDLCCLIEGQRPYNNRSGQQVLDGIADVWGRLRQAIDVGDRFDRMTLNANRSIAVAAQISITEGAVSGKAHVPSAPGSPPNNDTGVLANNIETAQIAVDRVEVSSSAPYAAAQEFGNSKLPARPYMGPAAAAERKNVTELVRRAIDHVNKGGKLT